MSLLLKCKNKLPYLNKSRRSFRWFSPGTPVSSSNKIDHHDITEILLKVALNTINLTLK
jgi:hypothetical protein